MQKKSSRSTEEIRQVNREDRICDNYDKMHEFVTGLLKERLGDKEIAERIEKEFGVSISETMEALSKSDAEYETTANGLAKYLCELM